MTRSNLFIKTQEKILLIMCFSIFYMSIFDLWATQRGIALGLFNELNPAMNYVLNLNLISFYIVKLLITATALFFLWFKRGHYLARLGLIALLIVYVSIVVVHISIMFA